MTSTSPEGTPQIEGRRVRVLVEPMTETRVAARRRRGLGVEKSGIMQDADTGQILIVAKISYIDAKIAERGHRVVERRAQEPGDLDAL